MSGHTLASPPALAPITASWANYDGGFAPAAYWKDSTGLVHLRGLVYPAVSVEAATPIFTLPAGFRPKATETFIAWCGAGGPERIDVTSGGVVMILLLLAGGAENYLSLSGISFLAAI